MSKNHQTFSRLRLVVHYSFLQYIAFFNMCIHLCPADTMLLWDNDSLQIRL